MTAANVQKKTATENAKNYNKSYIGTYKVSANGGLNLRNGAGTEKTLMVTMPNTSTVECKGYYTAVGDVKWFYVQTTLKNVIYTGFCSSAYLIKS